MQLKFHSFKVKKAHGVNKPYYMSEGNCVLDKSDFSSLLIEASVCYESIPSKKNFKGQIPNLCVLPLYPVTNADLIKGIMTIPPSINPRKTELNELPFIVERKVLLTLAIFDLFDGNQEADKIELFYDKKKDAIVVVDLTNVVKATIRKENSVYDAFSFSYVRYDYKHPYIKHISDKEDVIVIPKGIKNPYRWSQRKFEKSIKYLSVPALNKLDYAVKKDIVISGYDGHPNKPIYKTTKERI